MSREERRYLSYLLRLWQIKSDGELIWQASLQSSQTGKRRGFTSLDGVFAFLQQQMGSAPDSDGEDAELGGKGGM